MGWVGWAWCGHRHQSGGCAVSSVAAKAIHFILEVANSRVQVFDELPHNLVTHSRGRAEKVADFLFGERHARTLSGVAL